MRQTSTQVPVESPLQGELARRKTELARLGFTIVPITDGVVATRSRFHWDCFFTKLDYAVFVRRVGHLDEERFAAEQERLDQEARDLDTSVLPRGLQKGSAVFAVFIADTVDPTLAERLRTTRTKGGFARLSFPVVVDLSTGVATYQQTTPVVGGIYYARFRHLAARLADPDAPETPEPVSKMGIGLTTLMVMGILGPALARLFF